jgi:AcrR family transcriptional regulator
MDPVIPPKRKYELKQRAAEMAETRRRITEAAVELHGTIGPARTTMSAVAARAGVQRHTVYRHFPSEMDLFGACSAHFFAQHPWPDIESWRSIGDPDRRLALALDELYAYYERTEPMFSNVLRDVEVVETLRPPLAAVEALLAEMTEILAAGRTVRGRRRRVLTAALRHVLDFHTWRSLTVDNGLGRTEAVELVTALVEADGSRPAKRNQGASYTTRSEGL